MKKNILQIKKIGHFINFNITKNTYFDNCVDMVDLLVVYDETSGGRFKTSYCHKCHHLKQILRKRGGARGVARN